MSKRQHTSKRFHLIPLPSSCAGVKWSAGAALALSLSVGLAGCGGEDTSVATPGALAAMGGGMNEPTAPTGEGPSPEPVQEPTPGEPAPGGSGEQAPPVAGIDMPGETGGEAPIEDPSVEPVPIIEPPIDCAPIENSGAADDGDVNVDLATEFQTISGFGGISVPGWIPDLTPEQVQTAFGRGPGQLGFTILRVRIPHQAENFAAEVPAPQLAVALGARVIASPWTPPAALKSNNDIVGGELPPANYGAYADHLLSFRDFMAENGVALEAISVQNEPDITVTYESCDWTAQQIADFLVQQGPRFGETKLIAAESFNFNRQMTDPLLNDPEVAAEFEIVGGHIYGNGLFDYPLARQAGKEVWMTEHYTDSNNPANAWPNALNVGAELHDVMQANFNAYIWWYIRRSYGPITDDGFVSKRGYLMSQYARFVRPGYIRVAASQPANGVQVTAYKNGPGRVVVVALNETTAVQTVSLDIFGACVTTFDRFTTSETKNAADDGPVTLENRRVTVTLDAQSVTTFVSQ
jgi:glucuronoarabinoxylan endo-1,4-beta-xylanase